MILETKQKEYAYIWNTAERVCLAPGTFLSDYTGIEEEIGEYALIRPLAKAQERAVIKNEPMRKPALMMVTTGVNISCRIWVDKDNLIERKDIKDPKKTFEYYCED